MRCTHNTKTIAAAGRFSSLEILFDFELFMMVAVANISFGKARQRTLWRVLPVAELAAVPDDYWDHHQCREVL